MGLKKKLNRKFKYPKTYQHSRCSIKFLSKPCQNRFCFLLPIILIIFVLGHLACEGDCSHQGLLRNDFIRHIGQHCQDSVNFERYLVRHYFVNNNFDYEWLEEPSGFCLNGFLTALLIVAQHDMAEYPPNAQRPLALANFIIGHYHAFDYLESSTWPITSYTILANLQNVIRGSGEFISLQEPPNYHHPGCDGGVFYARLLSWKGTSEGGKPYNRQVERFLPDISNGMYPLMVNPNDASFNVNPINGLRPQIKIWQACIHTSTAGEALTMISRFLKDEFEVVFKGNSLATKICRNYDPHLCANEETARFLEDFTHARDLEEERERFQTSDLYMDGARRYDVLMCSIPVHWCQLYYGLDQPVLAYFGLPTLQNVAQDQRNPLLKILSHIECI